MDQSHKGTNVDIRAYYTGAFDNAVQASNMRIYIQRRVKFLIRYKRPGSKINILTWFCHDYVITNAVICSAMRDKMVGASEMGCTMGHQHVIEKTKELQEPEVSSV